MARIHWSIYFLFALTVALYATAEIVIHSVESVESRFVEHRCVDPGQGI